MSLSGALSIAMGGVANIESRLAVVSQNVANANTPGYAAEVGNQISQSVGGAGAGVRSLPVTRLTDATLRAQTLQLVSTVADMTSRQSALQNLDAVQGIPGQGNDLASLVGALGNQFSSLLNQPDSQTAQSAVVGAATILTTAINTISTAYTTQRNAAQSNLVASVASMNLALNQIGSISDQVMTLKAANQSTADLENQRDAVVSRLSGLLNVKTMESQNGDLAVITSAGLTLPTRESSGPFTLANATAVPQSSYAAGTIPGVLLKGQDVTGRLSGGQTGANIALRDTVIPTYQAELDEFSITISSRFSEQGLTLFTDSTGVVPALPGVPVQAGYVGFASTIQVNPAVSGSPSLVRDGTHAVVGGPAGATAFTPNPPGGSAGFSTLINRVLTYALGSDVQSGVAQAPVNTTGLGPAGTLQAPFSTPAALSDFASSLIGSQAQDSAMVTNQLQTEHAVQTSLTTKLSAETGVNMDAEMASVVALQNAYGINARIISAVQSMWTQLLTAVQ